MRIDGLSASIELSNVLAEAQDIAAQVSQPLSSAHILLAMFTVENRAQELLEERGINENGVLDQLTELESEPVDTIPVIHRKTAKIARNCDSRVIGTMHLLAGFCRVHQSLAYKCLEIGGIKPADLRTSAIRFLTGGMPRRYRYQTAEPHGDRVEYRGLANGTSNDTAAPAVVTVAQTESVRQPDSQRDAQSDLPQLAALAAELSSPLPPPMDDLDDDGPVPFSEQTRSSRYRLDAETFPVLSQLGRNLTVMAELGKLDPLIGRERELEQIIDILNKRRSNNPCLVGEPGVGKTAVIEGLAQRIVDHSDEVGALGEKILVELQMGTLLAGTQLRGAFSERMGALKEEVEVADGRVILFIDEIHTLVGAGAGDGPLDAANELKSALARGDFPCIGATTAKEYRRHIESDPALARRFQVVRAEEPCSEDALAVIEGLQRQYSEHHQVKYRGEALESAVYLTSRWIHDRQLPAKAIDVLDQAGAYAVRQGQSFVGKEDVARVVAQQAGVPEERLLQDDSERMLSLESYLNGRVFGHPQPLARIAACLRRNYAGFTTSRPMGSFLLLGPTGVGKTESAKVLAEFLFGSRDAMVRIDMSEYMDSHSLSRLIGAPPGYVGHDDGGQLTEAVRGRPYQIILLDEIEKASSEVLNVLLQLLEEGQLTDGRGRQVQFQHTVVIMTSNLGHEHCGEQRRAVGFAAQVTPEDVAGKVIESARKKFLPELWNRIEEKLVYGALTVDDIEKIANMLLTESSQRLQRERSIGYRTTEAVVPFLLENGGFDPEYGARPMRRVIQELVEGPVAEAILSGRAQQGDHLTVGVIDGRIAVLA